MYLSVHVCFYASFGTMEICSTGALSEVKKFRFRKQNYPNSCWFQPFAEQADSNHLDMQMRTTKADWLQQLAQCLGCLGVYGIDQWQPYKSCKHGILRPPHSSPILDDASSCEGSILDDASSCEGSKGSLGFECFILKQRGAGD